MNTYAIPNEYYVPRPLSGVVLVFMLLFTAITSIAGVAGDYVGWGFMILFGAMTLFTSITFFTEDARNSIAAAACMARCVGVVLIAFITFAVVATLTTGLCIGMFIILGNSNGNASPEDELFACLVVGVFAGIVAAIKLLMEMFSIN